VALTVLMKRQIPLVPPMMLYLDAVKAASEIRKRIIVAAQPMYQLIFRYYGANSRLGACCSQR
jgi:hypothetical protein